MDKINKRSIVNRARDRLLALSGFLSHILFWFLLNCIFYILLVACHLSCARCIHGEWWSEFYGIASSFLVGGIVSFLFYFLVVYLPERRKRRIIKSNLKEQYVDIKHDILCQIIFASQKGGRDDISCDTQTIDRLMTPDGFRTVFEGGREGDEGFYAFRNYVGGDDVPEYREIILNLQVLSRQIDYVLHNYPITEKKIFDFFKRLETLLMRLEKTGPGYVEEKALSGFIWDIFAGWSFMSGYRGYDIIEKMIEDI